MTQKRKAEKQIQWKEVARIVRNLSNTVIEVAERVRGQSNIGSQVESIAVWEAIQLSYDEAGNPKPDFQFRRTIKRNLIVLLHRASQYIITSTSQYTEAFDACSDACSDPAISKNDFDNYVITLVSKALRSRRCDTRRRNVTQTEFLFMDALKGNIPTRTASVKLVGVSFPKTGFAIKVGPLTVRCRRPIARDLRREVSASDTSSMIGFWGDLFTNPSAIATLSLKSRRPMELQAAVERTIGILRLFKVASVGHISYEMSTLGSYRPLDCGTATLSPGSIFRGPEHLAITSSLREPLRRFWRTISPEFEKMLQTTETNPSPAKLSYEYYVEGLRSDQWKERRIANAVMGLEALLLGKNAGELTFRIGLSLAKLLGFLGLDPREVRKLAGIAYTVRSSFAHGDRMHGKAKRAIETKYGGVEQFTRTILDYLRRLIVMFLLVKSRKKDLLPLTVESLIDQSSHQDLAKLLKPVCRIL